MKLLQGDCIDILKTLEDNSIDAIVTDPPAGISFMGKSWDTDKGGRDNWIKWMQEVATECKRVLKPGGHAFVWAIPRTSHWTATAWENAGFEIRDVVAHVFGSGFPKSHNIGKNIEKIKVGGIKNLKQVGTKKGIKVETGTQGFSYSKEYVAGKSMGGKQISGDIPVYEINNEYEGWGTALKPAREDWILMRKPLEKGLSIAENCLKWGVGGINIDQCRVGLIDGVDDSQLRTMNRSAKSEENGWGMNQNSGDNPQVVSPQGRFPANLIHDGSDEVVELFPNTKTGAVKTTIDNGANQPINLGGGLTKERPADSGSAARFFYKANFNYQDICADQNQINFAQYVESKLTGQEKLTVQEAVEILEAQEDLPYQQELQAIQGFIGNYKNYSQSQKDVNAEKWGSTDIILIMLNLLKLSGYVQLAIEGNINSEKKEVAVENGEHKRFLYQAKASKSERNMGCEGLEEKIVNDGREKDIDNAFQRGITLRKNTHPTVKPIALMEYLIKLVSREGHTILDPFMGSGSTGIACKKLNRHFIGIEREPDYITIAENRIEAVPKTLF